MEGRPSQLASATCSCKLRCYRAAPALSVAPGSSTPRQSKSVQLCFKSCVSVPLCGLWYQEAEDAEDALNFFALRRWVCTCTHCHCACKLSAVSRCIEKNCTCIVSCTLVISSIMSCHACDTCSDNTNQLVISIMSEELVQD